MSLGNFLIAINSLVVGAIMGHHAGVTSQKQKQEPVVCDPATSVMLLEKGFYYASAFYSKGPTNLTYEDGMRSTRPCESGGGWVSLQLTKVAE